MQKVVILILNLILNFDVVKVYNDSLFGSNSITHVFKPKNKNYLWLFLKGQMIKFQNGKIIDIKLFFIFNGNKVDPNYGNNEHIYNAYNNPDRFFLIYDSNWIYEKISSMAKNHRNKVEFTFHPENSNFSLLDNQALYTFSIGNTRAANFRILATEICELIEKEIEGLKIWQISQEIIDRCEQVMINYAKNKAKK